MEYYDGDLTPEQSLISLQTADAILATTLHGRDWTHHANEDRRACLDDPERTPQRDDHKAALQDASAVMAVQLWKGHKASSSQPQPFPRVGVHVPTGEAVIGIPAPVQRATAILAAHLVRQADQPLTPEILKSYAVGESRGVFREPSIDPLPRPVRELIAPFLNAGPSWSPVRA